MVSTAASTTAPTGRPARPSLRWRVVDIVVASVLGVAGGLVMTLWNLVYSPLTAPIEAAWPMQYVATSQLM